MKAFINRDLLAVKANYKDKMDRNREKLYVYTTDSEWQALRVKEMLMDLPDYYNIRIEHISNK